MIKLFIHDDVTSNKTEINISQFDMLSDLYVKFIKNETKDSSIIFGKVLIFQDIILSGGRMKGRNYGKLIKVYNIKNKSELWWGKIENYIKKDDIILEMRLGMNGGDSIYFIMKKTDSLSKIYSKIKTIVSVSFEIWDMKRNGIVDDENKIIIDIDPDSNYYRLIIGETFDGSCKCYIEYLLKYFLCDILELRYWSQFVDYDTKTKGREWLKRLIKYRLIPINETDSQFLADNVCTSKEYIDKVDEVLINSCKEKINKSKQEILSNSKFDYYLPCVFLNSRFLFCVHLIDIFADYFHICTHSFNGFLKVASQFAVIYYVYENRFVRFISEKSMRNILVDILDYCENLIVNSILDIKYWVKIFLDLFIDRSFTDLELDDILHEFFNPGMTSFPIEINKKPHNIYHKYPKTILDLKKAISKKTGLPLNQFFFLGYTLDEAPNDDDEFIDNWSYSIEFVNSIENIEILKVVGSGAYGNVHLCKNKLSDQLIALKIIKDKTKDLFREINILNRFKFSDQLCGYSQLIGVNGGIGLAMKFLQGGSLNSYLMKNRISEQQIAKWCYQILIQLNELHENGIIHRDIKADNIGLDEYNNAYLIDFGLSKCSQYYTSEELLENLNNYKPGTQIFMAPEIINSKKYTNKIDIWSLGATVINMLTGKRPYPSMTIMQAIVRISRTQKIDYEPLEQLSNELENFIELCLIPNENERASASDLLNSKFILKHRSDFTK